jgi:DNA-binding SARP family transcriptional activator
MIISRWREVWPRKYEQATHDAAVTITSPPTEQGVITVDASDADAIRSSMLGRHAGDQPDVSVRMLGSFKVGVEARWVQAWGGQRGRTLLQYLLVRGRPVHREVLMELLWPGHTYASARNNLNVCLYGLRRVVGAAATGHLIVYLDGCYGLNEDLTWEVDRDRFNAAADAMRRHDRAGRSADALAAGARAVSSYGGPMFDGDPVADWFEAERVALHGVYLELLERVAELDLQQGDLAGAEHSLQQLLRSDGCRESAHRLLMHCFASRGQRDLVTRQYQRCVATLRGELDITPSPQTVDLFHQLVETS